MYVKNVLMDTNEGLYIDLTDLNTRLDNIHKPHHDGTDEVPTPKEETQNVSVLWGPVALGETAKFYAWQACYYIYTEETATVYNKERIYQRPVKTIDSSGNIITTYAEDSFWNGVISITVHYDWYDVVNRCYGYSDNGTTKWTAVHEMVNRSTRDSTYTVYAGGLGDSNGNVKSGLTIAGQYALESKWSAPVVKNSEGDSVTNYKINRVYVSNAIIYTTSLPTVNTAKENLQYTTIDIHKDLTHPYNITETKTYVDPSNFFSISTMYKGFDIINAEKKNTFYLKTTYTATTLNIIESNFNMWAIVVPKTTTKGVVLLDHTERYTYERKPNEDESLSFDKAMDFITYSESSIVNQLKNTYTEITSVEVQQVNEALETVWFNSNTGSSTAETKVPVDNSWSTEIDDYFNDTKVKRTRGNNMLYEMADLKEGILAKDLVATAFTNTTFYSHIPVYVCDNTGMKMLCTYQSSDQESISGTTKNVAHFMPATNTSVVYLQDTDATGLRSILPTAAYSSKYVVNYGGFVRVPYYDKTVPLKGVYITTEDGGLSPHAVGISTTDPYHLYYATSDTDSEYKNVVNAKSISSYGSPM